MAPVATLPRMGLGTAASSAASCDKLAVAVETYVRRGGSAIDTAFTYCGFGGRKHFALDQIAKGLTAAGAARQQIWLTSKVPVGMIGLRRHHGRHECNAASAPDRGTPTSRSFASRLDGLTAL